jgi:aspartyl-tRNA(Asn)/glutamyl-tRNA(Gln) amidotransferase subunit A
MLTLQTLSEALSGGRVRARELIEQCLARIADPCGQGPVTFLHVFASEARALAEAIDRVRSAGVRAPPLAGIPVSIKDLFDVAGLPTAAGSKVLRSRPAAQRDAAAVERLRAAGMIVIGRTNMTELAFSGLGINPHFGTPLNPYERAAARVPGGSSSGAAISVTDEMAFAGLGTDTGGSVRIPAALSGIVGFKPTAERVSRRGVAPLSRTLDSVGWMARSVSCCAWLDAILCGEELERREGEPFPLSGLRLLAPPSYVLEDLDRAVAEAFEHSLQSLSRAGAHISSTSIAELTRLPEINAKGGFSAPESYAEYGELLEAHTDGFDPRVAVRILKGREQTAVDYLRLLRARAELIAQVGRKTEPFDAVVMPTCPIIAPPLAALAGDEAYFRANRLVLRNTSIANFLDRCAISIPVHRAREAPVGLMLMGEHGRDRQLLAIARSVESLLAPLDA